ncbi:MAG: cysteine desulfurase, partial [Actinomycetia bacterium]|nr:cysteine desulfurase [Actinomycetes bacterium]
MDRGIYLDHAATTPVRREVQEALNEALSTTFGNASSIHTFGQEAKRVLEESRERVATCIGAESEEMIFTSGGTEGDNLAIRGTAYALKEKGRHIITTAIEHPAVLNCCGALEEEGFEVTYLPVDLECRVHPQWVLEAIRPETILVTVMFANNETGSIQPIAEIGKIARQRGVLFHTDAVQAAGKVPVDVEELGVDLLSMSAHKIYGPKGIGGLYVRKGISLHPLTYGGHHERNLRPGTENVPGIAAFAKAIELATGELDISGKHLEMLKERLATGIQERIELVHCNSSPTECLPNILNVSFAGVDGEALLLNLDLMGVAVSTGSACSSGATEPSNVLLAMGVEPLLAQASLRFSFGRDNTEEQVERVLEVLPETVNRLRDLG